MAILELNLDQYLASMDEALLFLVFVDLLKACDTIYCGNLLNTLEVYGAGPHMCRLLEVFWDQQKVITCQNG